MNFSVLISIAVLTKITEKEVSIRIAKSKNNYSNTFYNRPSLYSKRHFDKKCLQKILKKISKKGARRRMIIFDIYQSGYSKVSKKALKELLISGLRC